MSGPELQADFDRFYEDFYIELAKYGHLLEMHVSLHPLSNLHPCKARLEPDTDVPRSATMSAITSWATFTLDTNGKRKRPKHSMD